MPLEDIKHLRIINILRTMSYIIISLTKTEAQRTRRDFSWPTHGVNWCKCTLIKTRSESVPEEFEGSLLPLLCIGYVTMHLHYTSAN